MRNPNGPATFLLSPGLTSEPRLIIELNESCPVGPCTVREGDFGFDKEPAASFEDSRNRLVIGASRKIHFSGVFLFLHLPHNDPGGSVSHRTLALRQGSQAGVRPLRRLRIGAAIVLEVGVNDSGLSSILTRKPIAESSCGSGIAAVLRDEKM